MIALALALVAAVGMYLLVTPRRVSGVSARAVARSLRSTTRKWLTQAGLEHVQASEFFAAIALLGCFTALGGWLVFGSILTALAVGLFGALLPIAIFRQRRERRVAVARESWPRMIEELRVLTGSLGRSLPQALFEVGRRSPAELQSAFLVAEREWLLTTNFEQTLGVLRDRLCDPTADAVCETLSVAYQLGGNDLDKRLAALAEDRSIDLNGRKDARAKQAGVRFARRFVLIVPAGMALVGLSIGNGRAAYQTSGGQLGVLVGLGMLALCWAWAGTLLRLPGESRVFASNGPTT